MGGSAPYGRKAGRKQVAMKVGRPMGSCLMIANPTQSLITQPPLKALESPVAGDKPAAAAVIPIGNLGKGTIDLLNYIVRVHLSQFPDHSLGTKALECLLPRS